MCACEAQLDALRPVVAELRRRLTLLTHELEPPK